MHESTLHTGILNIISIRPEIGVKSLSLTMLNQAIVLFYVDDIHQPAQNDPVYPSTPKNFQVDFKVKDKGQFNMTACTFPIPIPNF